MDGYSWKDLAPDSVLTIMKTLAGRRRRDEPAENMEGFIVMSLINALYEAAALGSCYTTPDGELVGPPDLPLTYSFLATPESVHAQFVDYLEWLYGDDTPPHLAWLCTYFARKHEDPRLSYNGFVRAAETLLAWRTLDEESHLKMRQVLFERYGITPNRWLKS